MLVKLIKHEFRATAKYMWYIFGGMLLLTILTRFAAIPLMMKFDNTLVNLLGTLIIIAFGLGTAALAFAPLVVSASRFKKSILGDEGYLTMSLPVSSYQHINAKLITNAVWYALTGIVLMLIAIVMIGSGQAPAGVFVGYRNFVEALNSMSAEEGRMIGHILLLGFEFLVDLVIVVSLFTVATYAAYAIGFSANKRKSLWTVLLIYGFFHVVIWSGILSLLAIGNNISINAETTFFAGMKAFEGALLWELLIMLVVGGAFYWVTNHFITKKLNLE